MYCRCKIKAVLTCWCCGGRRRGPRRRGPSPTSGSRGGTTCLQVDIWIIMADIREKKSRLYSIWYYSQPHPKTEEFMDNPCCSMKRPLTPCQHQTAAPYLRTASAVLSVEIVFAPGPRITLSHIPPCSATARNMKT